MRVCRPRQTDAANGKRSMLQQLQVQVAARTSAAAAAADNALHLKSCGRNKRCRALTMYVPAAYGRSGVGAWLSRTSVVLNVAMQIEFVKHKSRAKEIKT